MSEIKLTSESFKGYPNQKAFRVIKSREAENKTDVRISELFKKDIFMACRDLKDTTFKLYMYFISNQDNFIGGLSMKNVINQIGISESSYRRSIKELEEKGYLIYSQIQASDYDNSKLPLYDFYARPDLYSI